MGLFKNFFSLDEEYDDEYDEDTIEAQDTREKKKQGEDIDLLPHYFRKSSLDPHPDQIDFSINIVRAESTSVFHDVAHTLKTGGCVALSIKDVPHEERQRLTDCICGLIYAIDGHIEQESTKPDVLLLTPKNIEITSGNYQTIMSRIASL